MLGDSGTCGEWQSGAESGTTPTHAAVTNEAELREALLLLLRVDTLALVGAHAHGLHSADEIAFRLEHEALRSERASEGYNERNRYDLAAGERWRARELRRRAAALRLIFAHVHADGTTP